MAQRTRNCTQHEAQPKQCLQERRVIVTELTQLLQFHSLAVVHAHQYSLCVQAEAGATSAAACPAALGSRSELCKALLIGTVCCAGRGRGNQSSGMGMPSGSGNADFRAGPSADQKAAAARQRAQLVADLQAQV